MHTRPSTANIISARAHMLMQLHGSTQQVPSKKAANAVVLGNFFATTSAKDATFLLPVKHLPNNVNVSFSVVSIFISSALLKIGQIQTTDQSDAILLLFSIFCISCTICIINKMLPMMRQLAANTAGSHVMVTGYGRHGTPCTAPPCIAY